MQAHMLSYIRIWDMPTVLSLRHEMTWKPSVWVCKGVHDSVLPLLRPSVQLLKEKIIFLFEAILSDCVCVSFLKRGLIYLKGE